MVSIPGGTFRMGDLNGGGDDVERPVHSVTVPDFKLGKFEVTFTQWDACVADGGCGRYTPDDRGWGRGNRPVMSVSWDDIQGFIDWLNARTGGNFRLPTEGGVGVCVPGREHHKVQLGQQHRQQPGKL